MNHLRKPLEDLMKSVESRLGGIHTLHGTEAACDCDYCQAYKQAEETLSLPDPPDAEELLRELVKAVMEMPQGLDGVMAGHVTMMAKKAQSYLDSRGKQ